MDEKTLLSTSSDIKSEISKELKSQTAKWIIATVSLLILTAVSGWWLFLQSIIVEIVGGVPSGAVMAFNLPKCPKGWTPVDDFIGKTIIGSGKINDKKTIGIGTTGGNETIVLSEAQLPEHYHIEAVHSCSGSSGTEWGYLRAHSFDVCTEQKTKSVGKGDSINIMPPYVACLYCQKN
jgi:hypothetical protein